MAKSPKSKFVPSLHGGMMERSVFREWGEHFGLATRFSEFFSRAEVQDLVQAFRTSDCDEPADPDVIPYLLLNYVWPEEKWREIAPLTKERQEIAGRLRVFAGQLRAVRDTMSSEPRSTGPTIEDQLDQMAKDLEAPVPIRVGPLILYGRPPAHRRDRARRQVVFFLTGYFESLGRTTPPWPLITKFLILVRLATYNTTPKKIGTWWSNLKKREVTQKNPIEPHQNELVQWFREQKDIAADSCREYAS